MHQNSWVEKYGPLTLAELQVVMFGDKLNPESSDQFYHLRKQSTIKKLR